MRLDLTLAVAPRGRKGFFAGKRRKNPYFSGVLTLFQWITIGNNFGASGLFHAIASNKVCPKRQKRNI
jgi:hypothetical protein